MKVKLLLAAILATLASVTVAYASIPAPDGTIDGCYVTNPPRVLVVRDSTETCPSGTTALNWNQQGQRGPAGFANSATDESTSNTIGLAGPWTTVSTTTITLPAQDHVLLTADMDVQQNSGGPGAAAMRFVVDGSPVINGGIANTDNLYASVPGGASFTWVVVLAAGSHTISSQAKGSFEFVSTRTLTTIDLGS